MTQIKGADIARTRLYVYASMMNELVLEYLETGVKPVAQKSEATDAGHVHDENCNH
jgi:hypothetical protein